MDFHMITRTIRGHVDNTSLNYKTIENYRFSVKPYKSMRSYESIDDQNLDLMIN